LQQANSLDDVGAVVGDQIPDEIDFKL
jgi:hypothetical protein